jgi:integrating conjugative element protein (TIGR03752 family)
MSEKKTINPILYAAVGAVILIVIIIFSSGNDEKYKPISTLPTYKDEKPQDGDTQADTIKALQAYAKEAVQKAENLNSRTRGQATAVHENSSNVKRLSDENEATKDALDKTKAYTNVLESKLSLLEEKLAFLAEEQAKSNVPRDETGIPIGLGFDELNHRRSANEGAWHNPIDLVIEDEQGGNGFSGLLEPPGANLPPESIQPQTLEITNEITPFYTIPKDSVLADSTALTAMIGRIPVNGTTPDPYPLKIILGRESLLANGHDLPEIEGMIFSGVAIGDKTFSCVRARLFSATYIFNDGSIVNHTSDESLGYISDPYGQPCITGIFKTNAPSFLSKRIGLAAIGAAGSAFADAQRTTDRSSLTGSVSTSLSGQVGKLALGTSVQSATDEVTQWLLAREGQSFDAVFVEPGASVSIHLDIPLNIDHESLGRKVRFLSNTREFKNVLD